MTRLTQIKTLHTAIWAFMNIAIFYLLYAVLSVKIDVWVWICIGIILAECLVLLAYKGFCPLTIMARKYSKSTKDNFDIFLPEWLARYNKLIYGGVFVVIIFRLIYRLLKNY